MNIANYIEKNGEKWYLRIKVVPNYSRTEFFAIMDDNTLKIRLKAVPEKWKANTELIRFLSEALQIQKTSIELISWATDRTKLIRINY